MKKNQINRRQAVGTILSSALAGTLGLSIAPQVQAVANGAAGGSLGETRAAFLAIRHELAECRQIAMAFNAAAVPYSHPRKTPAPQQVRSDSSLPTPRAEAHLSEIRERLADIRSDLKRCVRIASGD